MPTINTEHPERCITRPELSIEQLRQHETGDPTYRELQMAEQHRQEEPTDRVRTFYRVKLSDVPEDAPVFEGTDVPVQYLFDYMARMQNLYAFLRDFPEVSAAQALNAIREHVKSEIPVHSDRGRVSGMPVFKGSRVPMRDLFAHLAEGVTVEDYLLGFPSAGREQVVKTIELASMLMEVVAYDNSIG